LKNIAVVPLLMLKPPCNSTAKRSKAIPLLAWTRPEGSSRLKLPDYKTIRT